MDHQFRYVCYFSFTSFQKFLTFNHNCSTSISASDSTTSTRATSAISSRPNRHKSCPRGQANSCASRKNRPRPCARGKIETVPRSHRRASSCAGSLPRRKTHRRPRQSSCSCTSAISRGKIGTLRRQSPLSSLCTHRLQNFARMVTLNLRP